VLARVYRDSRVEVEVLRKKVNDAYSKIVEQIHSLKDLYNRVKKGAEESSKLLKDGESAPVDGL